MYVTCRLWCEFSTQVNLLLALDSLALKPKNRSFFFLEPCPYDKNKDYKKKSGSFFWGLHVLTPIVSMEINAVFVFIYLI